MKIPQPDEQKYKQQIKFLSILMVITALLIITIPLTVLIWFRISKINFEYHQQSDIKKICDCVMNDDVRDIKSIAKSLRWEISKTRGVLNLCLKNHYLEDYLLVGDVLKKSGESAGMSVGQAIAKKSVRKCPHCGGVAEYYEGEKATCVYCGNII